MSDRFSWAPDEPPATPEPPTPESPVPPASSNAVASPSSPYGSAPPAAPYGTTPPASPYGAPASAYGTATPASPYGSAAPGSPYGAPAGGPSPYDSSAPSVIQPAPAAGPAPYGASGYGPPPGYGTSSYGTAAAGYPAYGAPPYGGTAYPGSPPPYGTGYAAGTDGLAIGALVVGIVGGLIVPFIGSIVAVILGAVGLNRIKHSGRGGRGMAIAGIVMGVVWFAAWIGLIVLAVNVGSSPTYSPDTTDDSLQGQCGNSPTGSCNARFDLPVDGPAAHRFGAVDGWSADNPAVHVGPADLGSLL